MDVLELVRAKQGTARGGSLKKYREILSRLDKPEKNDAAALEKVLADLGKTVDEVERDREDFLLADELQAMIDAGEAAAEPCQKLAVEINAFSEETLRIKMEREQRSREMHGNFHGFQITKRSGIQALQRLAALREQRQDLFPA